MNDSQFNQIIEAIGIEPYYREPAGVIYCADCLDIMKKIPDGAVDLVLTDPPYPDYHSELYGYDEEPIKYLQKFGCKQLIFQSAKVAPLRNDHTAVHIWDKRTGCGSMYERIFEYNGTANYKVYRHYFINSTVAASFGRDTFTGHPSQKPIKLICELIEEYSKSNDIILDPFFGSGTTAVAAKQLGRKFIGIEINYSYCQIAAERLAQTELFAGDDQPVDDILRQEELF